MPGNPPAMIFFNEGSGTVTGTDLHQPLTFGSFGNPLETNSGYATGLAVSFALVSVMPKIMSSVGLYSA